MLANERVELAELEQEMKEPPHGSRNIASHPFALLHDANAARGRLHRA
jgi:hypothetical protein